MHWLLALVAVLAPIVVPLVWRVLAAVGIGAVSYLGISTLLDEAGTFIASSFQGLPTEVAAFLGVMNADRAISMILSAVVVRATFAGLSASGSIRRIVWNPPGGA